MLVVDDEARTTPQTGIEYFDSDEGRLPVLGHDFKLNGINYVTKQVRQIPSRCCARSALTTLELS